MSALLPAALVLLAGAGGAAAFLIGWTLAGLFLRRFVRTPGEFADDEGLAAAAGALRDEALRYAEKNARRRWRDPLPPLADDPLPDDLARDRAESGAAIRDDLWTDFRKDRR